MEDSFIRPALEADLRRLDEIRHELGRDAKPLCLMELATIGARYLKHKGVLDNQEQSEENNACSIVIDVDVDGNNEKWLLQFKNETHNHPTEIEPFGGSARAPSCNAPPSLKILLGVVQSASSSLSSESFPESTKAV